jgi:hypothetical protein
MPVPSTYQFVITSADLTGITGHHQITAHIEETTANGNVIKVIKGVPETLGVELTVLQSRWGGDIVRWRDWVAQQLLTRHKARQSVHYDVLGWAGQKFPLV